jgi:sugar-specific transcriptional regulator TrmB
MPFRTVLAPLGVTPDEEQIYRLLLTSPGSSTAELTARSTLGRHRLRRTVEQLEHKAMITRSAGVPARFHPAPPDIVVEALIGAREDELNRTRLDARQLTALMQTAPDQLHVRQVVEIQTGREAVVQRWTQLQRATRQSLEVFVRPPFTQTNIDEDESLQRSLHERGCAVRGLYSADALESPGILESLGRTIPLGEQARVASGIPVKLALFDRRMAFVPLAQSDEPAIMVVHASALLDALIALFDLCWGHGQPVELGADTAGAGRAVAVEDEVIALMSAGLKDDAIAHRLGVSTNTVRRRINALAQQYGVSSRFQIGLAIGRQSPRGGR